MVASCFAPASRREIASTRCSLQDNEQQTEQRLEKDKQRKTIKCAQENEQETEQRLEKDKQWKTITHAQENEQETKQRLEKDKHQKQ